MRYGGRGVLKNERLYYLCDSRSIVGNCLQFWAKGGRGYTYNLDNCEVYPESVALAMHKERKSDYPMPKDVVDSLAQRHLDHQFFDHYFETWRSTMAQKKAEESHNTQSTKG